MQLNQSHRKEIRLLIISSGLCILGFTAGVILRITKGIVTYDSTHIPGFTGMIFNVMGMLFTARLLMPVPILGIKQTKGWKDSLLVIRSIQLWQALMLLAAWVAIVAIVSLIDKQFAYG